MEALTAVGLIANIAQFVDIAAKAIKSAKEIQSSVTGLTKENKSLEDVTTEMRDLSIRLDPPTAEPKNDDERALRSLSRECHQLSEQILALLKKISPSDPKSIRQIMWTTLKILKHKREKEDLENKLTTYRGQLLLHLQRVTSLDMKTQFGALRELEYANQDALQALPKQIERLERDLQIDKLGPEAQEQIRSLLAMTDTAKAMVVRRVIIKRLAFDHMGARYDQVDSAHCETFRWIVEEDAVIDEKVTMCNARHLYLSWLANGQGMFHIAGKLGSGKSTLMKYLLEHSQTKTKLLEWTGQAKLVFVSYFFGRPGKPIQRSFSGMIQSLLYGILEASPELTSIAFLDLWTQIQAELSLGLEQSPVGKALPLDAVLCALETLLRDEGVQTNYRFCFFVDALDEYEDTIFRDYRYMVERLHSWVDISKNALKICVSSREYNVFENMFAANQRIRMQDLTRNDMQRYVNDRLEDILDIGNRKDITRKIVERSDGIFLWVVLVVKALREGVEDGHDIVRFEKELDILPTEMEELFQYLLDSIPSHRRQAAYRLFAILFRTLEKKGNLALSSCLYLEDLDQDIYFAEKPKFSRLEWYCSEIRNDANLIAVQDATGKKLAQSYCKGLLEPQDRIERGESAPMSLGFTHRSVPEFFAKSRVQGIIKEYTSGFDIDNAICQFTLADLRCSEHIDVCTLYAVKAFDWLYTEILVPRQTDPSFTFLLAVDTTIDHIRRLPRTTNRKVIQDIDQYQIDLKFTRNGRVDEMWPYGFLSDRTAYLLSPVYFFALNRRPGYTKWRMAQNNDLLDTVSKKRIMTTTGAAMYIDYRRLTGPMETFLKQFPRGSEIRIEKLLPHMEFENIDAIMCAIEKLKAAGRTSRAFTWDTSENPVDEGQPATTELSEPDSFKRHDPANDPPTEPPTAPLVLKSSSEPSVDYVDPPIEPSSMPLLDDTKAPHEPATAIGPTQELMKPDHRRTYVAIWLFAFCLSLFIAIKAPIVLL
ncbi:P-loop containing nucleoside triphosphate hydrolase [Pyrenophora teres f. maculata]|nr:P-loop containing nucleoside triphosphate hydrolase [Pyrenophora teres f. maculata]